MNFYGMMRHRFIGYDLNGHRDMAVRSWLIKPGDEEALEGRFIVSGGLNGAVVRVNDGTRERLVGGVLARLAPQGRGGGWGDVGASDRRTTIRAVVQEPVSHGAELVAALEALGGGADVAIVSVDDVPGAREADHEAWLRAMREVRNRRNLHVWRPVLAVLSAIEDGVLERATSVGVVSHHNEGLATQRLEIKEDRVRVPERREAGRLHECGIGYERVLECARNLVGRKLPTRTRHQELSQLEMPVRLALGIEIDPELYRSWNGGWTVVPQLESALFIDEGLPSAVKEELVGVDVIIIETLSEGPIRDLMKELVTSCTGRAPFALQPDSVAKGALVAARRLFDGDPVYFDFLPQISTIIQDIRGPKNFDLMPEGASLPAGKTYRSVEPAKLGLQASRKQICVYLKKQLEERPRKAVLELPNTSERVEEIRCVVEQAPAQGKARILLESEIFRAPMMVDWERAEELDEDWDSVLRSLKETRPTIPNRLVLPATRELWLDRPGRVGLLSLLRQAEASASPNWADLAGRLNSRENGAYCISSDGDPPQGTSREELALLSRIQRCALDQTLARVEGKIVENDNDALRFLTWLFKRCDQKLVPAMLEALETEVGSHPFVYHQANKRLIYQGLGRILSNRKPIRHVFDHLMSIPEKQWNSMNHVSCAAFLLSRTNEALEILKRGDVDKLARIGARTLKESIEGEPTNTLHYPPFLMVGLLRWRTIYDCALVAGRDPSADLMVAAVNYALPRLERWLPKHPNLQRFYRVLQDVEDELRGKGRNPDLLLELAR